MLFLRTDGWMTDGASFSCMGIIFCYFHILTQINNREDVRWGNVHVIVVYLTTPVISCQAEVEAYVGSRREHWFNLTSSEWHHLKLSLFWMGADFPVIVFNQPHNNSCHRQTVVHQTINLFKGFDPWTLLIFRWFIPPPNTYKDRWVVGAIKCLTTLGLFHGFYEGMPSGSTQNGLWFNTVSPLLLPQHFSC